MGANDGESITVNLQAINSETLGLEGFSVKQASLNVTELGDGSGVLTDVNLGTFATSLDADSLTLRNVQDADGDSTGNYAADMTAPTTPAITTIDDTATGGTTGLAVKVSLDADGDIAGYVSIDGTNYEADDAYATPAVNSETAEEFTGAATSDPLAKLDDALNIVDSLRSELGAVQNRFEDADYAVEVANMTRAQILQQAGTSVLAQANQIPQNVLSLLG